MMHKIVLRLAIVSAVPVALFGSFALGGQAAGLGDDDAARQAGSQMVQVLAAEEAPDGAFLPAGARVDRATWIGTVLHLDLTFPPESADWSPEPLAVEAISARLGEPFAKDDSFGGTVVRVRIGASGEYRHLEQFVRYPAGPRAEAIDDVPDRLVSELSARTYHDADGQGLRGGFTNAARQPAGALSGVVVFCTGGHGWTADTTDNNWFLQRQVLLDMNEDHGNLDQLNYFVHYVFNAGATVVPFRPVGYQTNEVVLDNDDPGVTYSAGWFDGSASKYYENGVTNSGVPYRAATASGVETETARYTPNIPEAGYYPIYTFALASSNRVRQLYRIQHSGGIAEVVVDHRAVGNGWVYLGQYYLTAGTDHYVEISNASADAGAVIADAIRFGNGIGDVSRAGAGISTYARDEEAHRYWAHSELGNNAVGFTASDIWDSSSTDQNDNVSAASRWAREMNQVPAGGVQVDRWKRIYLEFHTNATGGGARGCIALINGSSPTTNQAAYATYLADEVDADMLIADADFEHTWFDRASPTFTGSYGAISTVGNGDEFDATIIELAFHDDPIDAELLRDSRVRAAMARSCTQGIVRFLNDLSSGLVPLIFAPDTPRNFRVEDLGGGDVKLSWIAPLADGARGDAATGYVVYESTNGYGFGSPLVLGNVLTTTVSGVPIGETRYFRVAAINAGGESMPSETLAVRRPATGTATVIIVNGFDSLRRFQNPTQDVGGLIERQTWRNTNSADYVVQFASALDATSVGFASCSNEAITSNQISLGNYEMALWILGAERSEDATLDATEQQRITTFLNAGGALFISGAELGYDLVGLSHGATLMQSTFKALYIANDAGTSNVTSVGGSIFDGMGAFDFDFAAGAAYNVYEPDVLAAGAGATAALSYVGGSGGTAAVQYDATTYRVVTFGFPFEAISSAAVRAEVMARVIDYLEATIGPLLFDLDHDGDVDLTDYAAWDFCFKFGGPGKTFPNGSVCLARDGDGDADVDLADFMLFQQAYTGP